MNLFTVEIRVNPAHPWNMRFEHVISFEFRGNSVSVASDNGDFVIHETRPIDDEVISVTAFPE